MKTTIRKSTPNDLDFLKKLEISCFPKFQQSSTRAIRYSISSPFQKVLIAEYSDGREKKRAGSAILYLYAKTLRIFSIAVLPEMQGKGIGKQLLEYAVKLARSPLKFEKTIQKWLNFTKRQVSGLLKNCPIIT